jgi:hypothetical protein
MALLDGSLSHTRQGIVQRYWLLVKVVSSLFLARMLMLVFVAAVVL